MSEDVAQEEVKATIVQLKKLPFSFASQHSVFLTAKDNEITLCYKKGFTFQVLAEVRRSLDRIDYQDAYGFLIFKKNVDVKDIARAFFTSAPKWIERLMQFRDKLGSIVGLKTMGRKNEQRDILPRILRS